MTTANKPENQKTQRSLSDLGQISTNQAISKAGAILKGLLEDCDHNESRALGFLANVVACLTSPDREKRERAKAVVRRLAKAGDQL